MRTKRLVSVTCYSTDTEIFICLEDIKVVAPRKLSSEDEYDATKVQYADVYFGWRPDGEEKPILMSMAELRRHGVI